MKKAYTIYGLFSVLILSCWLPGCGDDSGDDTDTATGSTDSTVDTASNGTSTSGESTDNDTATGTTDTATIASGDQGIGSACGCQGDDCSLLEVPIPSADGIVGCDDVPSDHEGVLVCLQTYSGEAATNTFFANGYCALQAIANCAGNVLICGSAEIGDYDAMTTCPAGSVMLTNNITAEATLPGTSVAVEATMDSKTCVKGCATDADCRGGETDPVLNAASGYACIEKAGVKFCYDPQNIKDDTYTATAF